MNEIVTNLWKVAASLNATAAIQKAKEDRFQAEMKRRAELREQLKSERDACRKLERRARDWRRAQKIQAYIAAVEASSTNLEDKERWLAWARLYADRLDPLSLTTPSILDIDENSIQPLAMWQWKDPEES